MMTKELHLKLLKYESIFRTAIDAKYCRAMDSRFAADFIDSCKELNVYIKLNCGLCILKALLTVGLIYFDYRDPETPANAELSDESDTSETPDKLEITDDSNVSVEADDKTIGNENKVNQNASKQPKKPIVTRSKTNKK